MQQYTEAAALPCGSGGSWWSTPTANRRSYELRAPGAVACQTLQRLPAREPEEEKSKEEPRHPDANWAKEGGKILVKKAPVQSWAGEGYGMYLDVDEAMSDEKKKDDTREQPKEAAAKSDEKKKDDDLDRRRRS